MRALCVFPVPPVPTDHAMRMPNWQFLTALAPVADITLLTWQPSHVPDEHFDAARDLACDVLVPPIPGLRPGLLPRLARRMRFVAGGDPPYVQALLEQRGLDDPVRADSLKRAVLDRHEAAPYDLVVLGEDAMARMPIPDLGVPVVVHRWNVFARLIADLDHNGGWRRLLVPLEAPGWRRFDRHVIRAATLVVTPTAEVARDVEVESPAARVVVVPNGVDREPLRTPPSSGHDLAFIGAMEYAANVDAVCWFAQNCWRQVRERFPSTTFRIIGREPVERVRRLHGNGIEVVGEVDDLTTACEGTRVGVVPLRAGMGIKNKTLELMAMGLPVVTLPAGAEGIGAGPDDGLIVVDGVAAFVDAVASLLDDPARAHRLGASAQRFVRAHHSWEDMRTQYRRHVESLLEANAQRSAS